MKSYLTYALIAVACVAVFAAGHFSGLYGWKATRSDSRELFTRNALAFSLSGVMEIGRTSPGTWKLWHGDDITRPVPLCKTYRQTEARRDLSPFPCRRIDGIRFGRDKQCCDDWRLS